MHLFKAVSPRCFAGALVFSVSLLLAGCADTPRANFTISSSRMGEAFRPSFDNALISRGDEGGDEYEIVLTGDTAGGGGDGMHQVMHVRVLYRPMRAVKADHPSATNATIRWYILGQDAPDVLEYAGAGFVIVRPGDDAANVEIRNATLKVVASSGRLHDSMGTISISGTAKAIRDPDDISKIVKDVQSRVGATRRTMAVPTTRPS